MEKNHSGTVDDNPNAISRNGPQTVASKYRLFKSKKFLSASFITSLFLVTITNTINSDIAKINSNIFFIVLPSVLAILSVKLLIKFPSERILLLGFALFSVLSAIAETLFIIYESVLQVNPFPSIADGFWLTGYLALFAFFVLYLRPLRRIIPKKIIILATLVSAGFLIPSVLQAYSLNANSNELALVVALAYPVIDALILCPVIIGMTMLYRKRSDPFLLAMLTAIMAFIASDSMYLAIYNSYENGNPIDIGWIFGYILFSYATLSYKSVSKGQSTSMMVDLKNKKIVHAITSETIIQFVIPLIVVSLVMTSAIFLIDYYFKEKARDATEDLTVPYVFFVVILALLVLIFVINRSLMKLVQLRTAELETERDILKQENDEKMQFIAKSKLLEVQLHKSFVELKKTERSKDEFIAMITHELRTPLVPIIAYSDILLSKHIGELNDMQKERISLIKSSSESLVRLVQDLFDVQKIELGELKLEKQENSLSEIINSVMIKIKPDIERCCISITADLETVPCCMCDKMRIEQVLNNILYNSIGFIPKENGKINIKLYMREGQFKIIIKDNGLGIKKDQLDKIFTKFYQIDTSTTRERGGTGLGLSVSLGIINAHGGKIWAESEGFGKGSEFHILLPVVTNFQISK
jgi:signal transduction histidine kinase